MAQKLELNKGLRSVRGVVGAITGRTPGEEETPPPDKSEPPPQPAEDTPPQAVAEPQQSDTGDHPVNAADPSPPQEEPEGTTREERSKSRKPAAKSVEARRGRPPGQVDAESAARKKVTLMIRTDLVNKYNTWSWGAQCNVGRLYERALEDFYQRKGPKESE
jgi:hypothetical protein